MLREVGIAMRNMVVGGSVKALTMKPTRALGYVNECLFLERLLNSDGDLPQKPITEVFGVHEVAIRLRPALAPQWFAPIASYQADLVALCSLAAVLQPKRIFEIGTLNGASALHFAINSEAEVLTLDLPPDSAPVLHSNFVDRAHQTMRPELVFRGLPEASRIHCIYGDSATFDFGQFRDSIDLFFIDGAHSYEYVKNDTLQSLECVKRGGVLCWHDYGRSGVNGVSKWLHEWRSQGKQIYRVPGGSLAYMRV